MRIRNLRTVLLLILLSSFLAACQRSSVPQSVAQPRADATARTTPTLVSLPQSVAQSHIDANVPEKPVFDSMLKRDLAQYFTQMLGKDVTVSYELLRDVPTQTGIAYPKFYLWVQIFDQATLIDQGAVRAAAIDQQQFDVTHYLTKAEIQQRPEQLDSIFPQSVVAKIKEHLK